MPSKRTVSSGRTGLLKRAFTPVTSPGSPRNRANASTPQASVQSPWRMTPPSPAAWPTSGSMWMGLKSPLAPA